MVGFMGLIPKNNLTYPKPIPLNPYEENIRKVCTVPLNFVYGYAQGLRFGVTAQRH